MQVGAFTLEFLRVTHSIPDSVAVAISTPRGVIFIRATSRSIRRRSTASTSMFTASRSWVSAGVLALLADSTNIDRRGFTGSEWTSPMASRKCSRAPKARLSSRCSRRASTACRSSSISRRNSIAVWRSSGAGPSTTRRLRSAWDTCGSRRACRSATATFAAFLLRMSCASAPARRVNRRRRCRGLPSTTTATSNWRRETSSSSQRGRFRATRKPSAG